MDPSEALFNTVRVPRQIVVHHQVGTLEVDSLASGVGSHEDFDGLVLGKQLLRLSPLVPSQAAVNDDEGLRPSEKPTDPVGKIVQCVSVLGEDDELPSVAIQVEHLALVLQKARKLVPFSVCAAVSYLECQRLEALQDADFRAKFGNCAGCRSLVDDLLFGGFDLGVGGIVEVLERVIVELRQIPERIDLGFGAAPHELFLASLCANVSETATPREISEQGGEGIRDNHGRSRGIWGCQGGGRGAAQRA